MGGIGTVYLVGAGPGDPGLLTLRGRQCLESADLVLYDGLVNPLLLRQAHGKAERTSRVSDCLGCRLNQDEINSRLIEAARAGKTVVRLKGGDPFIFGRGAEEAAALRDAGVPFEIVPGVTAAIAAGIYAAIPFTHRQSASAVALITGHEDPEKPESALDFHALAAFPGTLVFYMGMHRLQTIAAALIECGKGPETPAAVICKASTPQQRTITATLATVADAAEAAQLSPPSLIVIGPCVLQRESIRWYESRPLFGLRIGITRPVAQADAPIQRCLELGADPVVMPVIEIRPPDNWHAVDQAIARLSEFNWLIFTSANGVAAFLQRMWELGLDTRRMAGMQVAAIGESTAEALAEWKLRADVVPNSYRAEELAAALAPCVAGCRILWARANRGRDVLARELTAAGADLQEVVVYRNIDAQTLPDAAMQAIEEGQLDWIGLSSPSIARNLARLLPARLRPVLGDRIRLCAISPVTADAAEEVGLPVHAVASDFTWNGIFDAIVAATSQAPATAAEH